MARVLLISGWATTPRVWDRVRAALPPGAAAETVDWWDALEMGATARVRDAIVVGWSLGALCALALSARGAMPHALVLLAGTARFTGDADASFPGVPPAALRAMRARLRADREACLRDFFASALAPQDNEETRAALCAEAHAIGSDALARGLEFLAKADVRADVASIAAPATIIHGERDAIVPCDAGRALASALRDAAFECLPECGHALPLAAPDAIAGAIARHVSTCS
jgi:pimeloyl-[acyl-carrier protein] methyl ester esterase